jgi:hypothetical protein
LVRVAPVSLLALKVKVLLAAPHHLARWLLVPLVGELAVMRLTGVGAVTLVIVPAILPLAVVTVRRVPVWLTMVAVMVAAVRLAAAVVLVAKVEAEALPEIVMVVAAGDHPKTMLAATVPTES